MMGLGIIIRVEYLLPGLQELPAAPEELVVELARRYVLLYEMITGNCFEPAPGGAECAQRMAARTRAALDAL